MHKKEIRLASYIFFRTVESFQCAQSAPPVPKPPEPDLTIKSKQPSSLPIWLISGGLLFGISIGSYLFWAQKSRIKPTPDELKNLQQSLKEGNK